jgi:hypothetical protein
MALVFQRFLSPPDSQIDRQYELWQPVAARPDSPQGQFLAGSAAVEAAVAVGWDNG